MKKCIKCNEEKGLTEFYVDRSTDDGLCRHCKTCQRTVRVNALEKKKSRKAASESGNSEDMIAWKVKYEPVIDWSTKECTGCKEIKKAKEFYPCNRNKNGLSSQCMECSKKTRGAYVALPFDPAPESKICTKCVKKLELKDFNKDRHKKDGYSSTCKSCDRAYQFKNKYGITIEDYDFMLTYQQNMWCYLRNASRSELCRF